MSTTFTFPDIQDTDKLLEMPDEDWYRHQADFCIQLYQHGESFPAWSDDRARWWFQSFTFFVDHFISPPLPRPGFHDDWYYWTVRYPAYMNLSPRDHGKTNVHSIFRVVWEICVNRNVTFFLVFGTLAIAKLIHGQIKVQLTKNRRIIEGFGVFNPMDLNPDERMVEQDWSQVSLTVNRDNLDLKDPTVAVAGALTNVLSRRVKRLYVDDILTDEIAFSDAESERLERWYFNDVQPVVEPEGQEIITGTRYRAGDFYDQILEKKGVYKTFVGDAIVDDDREITLWPERWNYDRLMDQRAKQGTVRFNRNYRNIIVSDEDSPFPMIWFRGGIADSGFIFPGCFDEDLILGQRPTIPKQRRWLRFSVLGIDPAIGQSDRSKYFAYVLLGLDYQNRLIIPDMGRSQMGFVAQKRAVVGLWDKWSPDYVVVESNAYQLALAEGIQEDAPDIVILPYYTGRKKSDPETGVISMDVYFESGRFRIPGGDEHSRQETDLLVDELHFWGKAATSDVAMALWVAFEKMRPELKRLRVLPPAKNAAFGDRKRRERRMVRGLSGQPTPKAALEILKKRAFRHPTIVKTPFSRKREPGAEDL